MSSDDFSTVNMRRGDRAREIEVLRQHYREHREQLQRLSTEAPSERLAVEYQRLVRDIDASLAKLDELEGRASAPATAPVRDTLLSQKTEPGTRTAPPPPPPPPPAAAAAAADETVRTAPASGARTVFMIVAAVIVVAILGLLVWRASRDRRAERPVIGETSTTTETTRTTSTAPPPVSPAPGTNTAVAAASGATLAVAPAVADYGTIRKGTRAVRQLEVTNTSAQPITYSVARSQCRCLFYDYTGKLAAKKKETLTVTVDGAKAKAGALNETVSITSKANPALKASFQVQATVQ